MSVYDIPHYINELMREIKPGMPTTKTLEMFNSKQFYNNLMEYTSMDKLNNNIQEDKLSKSKSVPENNTALIKVLVKPAFKKLLENLLNGMPMSIWFRQLAEQEVRRVKQVRSLATERSEAI